MNSADAFFQHLLFEDDHDIRNFLCYLTGRRYNNEAMFSLILSDYMEWKRKGF